MNQMWWRSDASRSQPEGWRWRQQAKGGDEDKRGTGAASDAGPCLPSNNGSSALVGTFWHVELQVGAEAELR